MQFFIIYTDSRNAIPYKNDLIMSGKQENQVRNDIIVVYFIINENEWNFQSGSKPLYIYNGNGYA